MLYPFYGPKHLLLEFGMNVDLQSHSFVVLLAIFFPKPGANSWTLMFTNMVCKFLWPKDKELSVIFNGYKNDIVPWN